MDLKKHFKTSYIAAHVDQVYKVFHLLVISFKTIKLMQSKKALHLGKGAYN